MGIYDGRGTLGKALKDLDARWVDAKTVWGDTRSREFEERFLEPLHLDLRTAIGAMDQMAVLLSKIRRECE